MKQSDLIPITFRLPESTLSKLSDVAEVLRQERKLIEHPNRQQLLQEAIEDFIAKHLSKGK
mgnify:CR=1 FL=1